MRWRLRTAVSKRELVNVPAEPLLDRLLLLA